MEKTKALKVRVKDKHAKLLKKMAGAVNFVWNYINELYTTQTCSYCKEISDSSPKGRAGLGVREWVCKYVAVLDRDVNAAKNILALGHERLAGGIPFL